METATRQILISQSMLKDLRKYSAGELCGAVFNAKYFLNNYPDSADDSKQKALGRFFEYHLSGGKSRDGSIPQAEYYKTSLEKKKKDPLYRLEEKDMTEPYALAYRNAKRVKEYFKKMGIKILEVGVKISRDGMTGTIDVIAMYKKRKVVLDIKYSGLLYNKYDAMGWMWTEAQKEFHGTQANHYHILTELPFYFVVCSSTNDEDFEIFEMEFDDFKLNKHKFLVDDARKKLEYLTEFGFNNHPEFSRCNVCPLKNGCQDRVEIPVPKVISLRFEE